MTIKYLDSKRISALSSDALVAHLKFNDNVTDSAGSNGGTVTGTTTYVTGKIGKGISLNGSSYVTLANESNFDFEHTDPFSMTFWIKMDSGSDGGTYYVNAKQNSGGGQVGLGLLLLSNGELRFGFDTASGNHRITSSNSVVTVSSGWTHVSITYDGSSNLSGCKIYINGTLDVTGSSSSITSTVLNNYAFVWGASSNGSLATPATYDDTRIYSRELDQNEVNVIYNGGTGTEGNLRPTNVQDNSILVEKDTGRRYWSSGYFPSATVTRSDDFSSDGWTDNDSTYIGVSGGSMNWNAKRDGSNDASVYDLGSVVSDNWVLRFKLTVTNVSSSTQAGNGFFVGLSDSDQTVSHGTSQDFIGVSIYNDNADTYRAIDADGSAIPDVYSGDSYQATTYNTGSIWYYEIIKTGSSYTVEAFSNSDYSTGSEGQITGSSNASGLQYLKIINDDMSVPTSTNPFQGTINDLKFYDGVTNTGSPATWSLEGLEKFYDTTATASNADWIIQVASGGHGTRAGMKILAGSPAIGKYVQNIKFKLSKFSSPSGNYQITVRDSSDTVKATADFSATGLPTSATIIDHDIGSPVKLAEGDRILYEYGVASGTKFWYNNSSGVSGFAMTYYNYSSAYVDDSTDQVIGAMDSQQ